MFNGKTSEQEEVFLFCGPGGQVHLEGSELADIEFKQLKISPRIGNTPRYIAFPDGSQFETSDNQAVDELLAQWSSNSSGFHRLIYLLESHKRYVAFSMVFLLVFVWGLVKYGIPGFSREIALVLPVEVSQILGEGVLESIDKYWADESQLKPERKAELEQLFNSLLPENEKKAFRWQIVFREGGVLGANAFALPNGTIVFTDELISLAANDQEIASVMLHEMGHVINRHGLRTVIQKSSLALLVMLVSGDVSTSSSIITALPAVLVEAGYSQGMEWEADSYALEKMLSNGMDPNAFADIMTNLETGTALPVCRENAEQNKELESKEQACIKSDELSAEKETATESQEHSIGNYFSTHPPTAKRIARFRNAEVK